MKLFGTDGIRGKVGEYPLTPDMISHIGDCVALFLTKKKSPVQTIPVHIFVGRDTRISGKKILDDLRVGLGGWVHIMDAGILPTPAIAFLNRRSADDAGIMITASHNPYYDNGIKFFDENGFKFSLQEEAEIEALIAKFTPRYFESPDKTNWMESDYFEYLEDVYVDFLIDSCPFQKDPSNLKIVVDCANGATFRVAPKLFKRFRMTPVLINIHPNGKNINENCGSEHPQGLIQKVLEEKADAGFALDGDGDRLVAVDETGTVLTGDQIIASLALDVKYRGKLKPPTVVTTVMSNMGLRMVLAKNSITHIEADVGDRNVVMAMRKAGALLGGEDSGHIIFLDQHTTGDGLFTMLRLMAVMANCNKKLSELRAETRVFPQVLLNVPVTSKPALETVAPISTAITAVEQALKGEGRVLVRYSGTQPLCRVMVEGVSDDAIRPYAHQIAATIEKELG